jgi:hypothetical protein
MLGRNMASEAAVRFPLRSPPTAFAEDGSTRQGPAASRSSRSWNLVANFLSPTPACTLSSTCRSQVKDPVLPLRSRTEHVSDPFGLQLPVHLRLLTARAGSILGTRCPTRCYGTPDRSPDPHSPLGLSPLGIVALSPVPNQEACHNGLPDLPSLPGHAVDLILPRNRIIVPGPLLSARNGTSRER